MRDASTFFLSHWAAYFDFQSGELWGSASPLTRGSISIFFSGYIVETQELTKRLNIKINSSYQEIAYHAWLKWGERMPQYVLGAYCAAIINKQIEKITLLQDSLGQRSIFYASDKGRLYFSDLLECLVSHVNWKEINKDYFAAWLRFGYAASNLTPYSSIARLIHGEVRHINKSRQSSLNPWSPSRSALKGKLTKNEAEEKLVFETEKAVIDSVADLKNPLYELSGGLDSSTVVSLANRLSARQISTITWISQDDDLYFSRRVVADLNLSNITKTKDVASIFEINDQGCFRSEPGNELCGGLEEALISMLGNRHDAVITGVGGDNIFFSRGTPPIWLSDILRSGNFLRAIKIARSPINREISQRSALSYIWIYGVRPLLNKFTIENCKFKNEYSPGFVERSLNIKPTMPPNDGDTPVQRFFWWQLRSLICNRVSVGHLVPSIDFRHPLLSRRLVEFTSGLLGKFEESLFSDRLLQRSAFREIVPSYILTRKTKGGSLKDDVSFVTEKSNRYQLQAKFSRAVQMEIIPPAAWDSLVSLAEYGRFKSLREFDFLMKTELWLRHIESRAPTNFEFFQIKTDS